MAKGGLAKQRFRERRQYNRIVGQLQTLKDAGYTADDIRAAGPNAWRELQGYNLVRDPLTGTYTNGATATVPGTTATVPGTTATATVPGTATTPNQYTNATIAPAWAQNAIAGPFNSAITAMTQPPLKNPPGITRFEDGSVQETFEDGSFRNITPTTTTTPAQPLQWWQRVQQAEQAKKAKTPQENQLGGVGTDPYGPVVPPGYTAPPNPTGNPFNKDAGPSIPFGKDFGISLPFVPQWLNGINSNGGVGNTPYGPVTPAGYVAPPNPVGSPKTGSVGGPKTWRNWTPLDFSMFASGPQYGSGGGGSSWYNNYRRRGRGGGGWKNWRPQQQGGYVSDGGNNYNNGPIWGAGLGNWNLG